MQIPATCQGWWSLSHINSASAFISAKNLRRSNEITTHRQSYRNTQSHVIFLYRDVKYVLTSQLDILLCKIVREHISGHCVKHDYVLYVMAKTAHFFCILISMLIWYLTLFYVTSTRGNWYSIPKCASRTYSLQNSYTWVHCVWRRSPPHRRDNSPLGLEGHSWPTRQIVNVLVLLKYPPDCLNRTEYAHRFRGSQIQLAKACFVTNLVPNYGS